MKAIIAWILSLLDYRSDDLASTGAPIRIEPEMTFDIAFERLIGHEGGYVNDPRDPGGETKYGISKRAYPNEDIRGMTLERAKEIYINDYWFMVGCDRAPSAARFDLFDMAVNSGVKRAIMTAQEALDVPVDGVIGPVTLQAMRSMPGPRFVARFNGARLHYMTELGTWPTFGKGWARRLAANLMNA